MRFHRKCGDAMNAMLCPAGGETRPLRVCGAELTVPTPSCPADPAANFELRAENRIAANKFKLGVFSPSAGGGGDDGGYEYDYDYAASTDVAGAGGHAAAAAECAAECLGNDKCVGFALDKAGFECRLYRTDASADARPKSEWTLYTRTCTVQQ